MKEKKERKESIKQIIVAFDWLKIEDVLETLTKMEYAPNLLFDDNNLWAIVTNGTQPITGKQILHGNMTFFCEKKDWAPTIRKALLKYLKSLIK